MLFNLEGQPVISRATARIMGTVDGVMLEGDKVTCFFCQKEGIVEGLELTHAVLGPHAVLISEDSELHRVNLGGSIIRTGMGVFSSNGVCLGEVKSITIDDHGRVLALGLGNAAVKYTAIERIGEVILVETEGPYGTEEPRQKAEDKAVQEAEEETKGAEDAMPEFLSSDDEFNEETEIEEQEVMPLKIVQKDRGEEENNDEVDERYKYLSGKKLLADLVIKDRVYKKGETIDPNLIKYAIENNTVIQLIMSADE